MFRCFVGFLVIFVVFVSSEEIVNETQREAITISGENAISEKLKNAIVQDLTSGALEELARDQRSLQLDYEDDYSDGPEARHFKLGPRRKQKPHRPHFGDHGCRRGHRKHHHCGSAGRQQPHGGYYPGNGGPVQSSAVSQGGGGSSQANAHSATFSLGPFSASFSSSRAKNRGI